MLRHTHIACLVNTQDIQKPGQCYIIIPYCSQYVRQPRLLKPRALIALVFLNVIQTIIYYLLLHYKVDFQLLN